ncbi:MAG: twin-arginine translocase TatA/TatE family subunit [Phycisphaerales bacterium]|nr:MAG: twin-arginine translocase TatA/TatE family subunit [Phycisphaerales bacterium]
MITQLALSFPHGMEWIVIGVIALLLFGKRLPEVARSVGRGIVEFKKGVKGIEDEIDGMSDEPPRKLESDQRTVSQEQRAPAREEPRPDAT